MLQSPIIPHFRIYLRLEYSKSLLSLIITTLIFLVCICLSDHPQLPDGHLDMLQDLRHPLLGAHLRR